MILKILNSFRGAQLKPKRLHELESLKFKSGDKVPKSGLYLERSFNNAVVAELICIKGERFPRNEQQHNCYEFAQVIKLQQAAR